MYNVVFISSAQQGDSVYMYLSSFLKFIYVFIVFDCTESSLLHAGFL